MDTQLIGLWSANEYEGWGGPAEEILIFKADGTGRYEVINYFPEFVELFEWRVTAPGYISLLGFKKISHEGEGKTSEEPSTFRFKNIPYHIQEQLVPSNRLMQVLTLSLPPRTDRLYKKFVPEHYGFIRRELERLEEPDFSPWSK
ncbi:hypothetical protein EON83_02250 [bacterium]|nr:MAG: hypothetical protein EON83_02250 [bacterium]